VSDIAIRVEGISKQYRIGGRQERYRTLRDTIAAATLAPLRRFRAAWRHSGVVSANNDETIWALKDISFEVKRGEVLGIIGRNGAGKSTLLKTLSRITEPTGGSADIYGRVASLLEVGTGFHPELTGRDNIYLNGAILGMRGTEIGRNFDEIVAFAEVEKFIDTPVKYYSSGMYLRLAFAVAAHLQPEILIVDEVLAVGDSTFQKKCIRKMGDVSRQGRTVLFVSHNMAAIRQLCTGAMLLSGGHVDFIGGVDAVLRRYAQCNGVVGSPGDDLTAITDRRGLGRIRFRSVSFETTAGDQLTTLTSGAALHIRVGLHGNTIPASLRISVTIKDTSDQVISVLDSYYTDDKLAGMCPKEAAICRVKRLTLAPGLYRMDLSMKDADRVQDWITLPAMIEVAEGNFYGTGRAMPAGAVTTLLDYHWCVDHPA